MYLAAWLLVALVLAFICCVALPVPFGHVGVQGPPVPMDFGMVAVLA